MPIELSEFKIPDRMALSSVNPESVDSFSRALITTLVRYFFTRLFDVSGKMLISKGTHPISTVNFDGVQDKHP